MFRKVLATTAVFLSIASTVKASDPTAVYAILDKVEIEPSDGKAERVRLWGTFSISLNRGDEYTVPAKGFLYYTLPEKNPEAAKREWNDLKKLAGTKQCVAFGARHLLVKRTVRTDKDTTKDAAPYPLSFGLTKIPADHPEAKKLLEFKPKP